MGSSFNLEKLVISSGWEGLAKPSPDWGILIDCVDLAKPSSDRSSRTDWGELVAPSFDLGKLVILSDWEGLAKLLSDQDILLGCAGLEKPSSDRSSRTDWGERVAPSFGLGKLVILSGWEGFAKLLSDQDILLGCAGLEKPSSDRSSRTDWGERVRPSFCLGEFVMLSSWGGLAE